MPTSGDTATSVTNTSPLRARPPQNSREPEHLDAQLGFLIHDVSRLRRSVFDKALRPIGLTRSQWWVIAHLSRHDGVTQSELAALLDLGKAALGGLLDRLEASSLVERRADSEDRRIKRIHLTNKGRQTSRAMRSQSHATSERSLQGLDVETRRALVAALALVKANLLAMRSAGADDD